MTQVSELLPAAFLGHGSPINALERNRFTEAWRNFGRAMVRPRGILVVSAHWYGRFTAVTSMERPRTIHDFGGFPDRLFAVDYPAPGDPVLAAEIADVVSPIPVALDGESWGIDHGAWSVLVHAFPEATIPVVQLSVHAGQPLGYHLELGARLAPLRQRGIAIIASGNVVHNLGLLDPGQPDAGFDWAHRFDDAARGHMTSKPGEVVSLDHHPDFRRAVPTPEHFIPLLYLAGLAEVAGTAADVLVHGYALGSLSMTSYAIGGSPPPLSPSTPPPPPPPPPLSGAEEP